MRTLSLSFILLLTVFPGTAGDSSKNGDDAVQPADLLDRAIRLEDIRVTGLPPVDVRAKLEVTSQDGKLASGDYALVWVSPTQGREEIHFSNFQRTRVYQANIYWQIRSVTYQPQAIFDIDKLLNLKSMLRLSSAQRMGKVSHRKEDGVRVSCTEVSGTNWIEKKLCFDETNGLLVSVDFPTPSHMNPPEISRIEYSEFSAWEGKLIPHRVRALNGRKEVAGLTIISLNKADAANSALFEPPKDSELWGNCAEDVRQPEQLVERVQPQYPPSARLNRISGKVTFYAVLGTNGTVSNLTIIHPASRELEEAAAQAVSHWRYKPVTCGGQPAQVETFIDVDFALNQ